MSKHPPQHRRAKQPPSIFAVAFLSSALTVSLACFMLFAFSFGFSGSVKPLLQLVKNFADVDQSTGPASDAGKFTDVSKLDSQGPIGIKSSLTASVAFKSAAPAAAEEPLDVVADSKTLEPEHETDGAGPEALDAAFNEADVNTAQPASLPEGVPAMLRRSRNGGNIEIGNFRSATMDGDAEECVSLGYSMLGAVKAKEDLLDVMVANKQITIAKICATNGTVVFSCRNGKISISPRRARPDDSCTRA